jgi:hypothetical protein
VSPEAVHAILADLERAATRVSTREDGREMWRFRVDDAGPVYELHFYPAEAVGAFPLLAAPSTAVREFTQLQSLQTLAIPATRVIANLKGLRLGNRKGDGCIIVHDPAVVPMDDLLRRDWPPPTHRRRLERLASFIAHLETLSKVNMTPVSLRADCFGVRGETTLLLEGSSLLSGKVDAGRLAELDTQTRHVTSVADRMRVWRALLGETTPPRRDRTLTRRARELVTAELFETGEFHEIESDGWAGKALRRSPMIVPWSIASGLSISHDQWLTALPALLDASGGKPIKFDQSSLVTTQTIELGGRSIEIVSKRPAFKPGFRGNFDRYRRSRVMRAWQKTWRLLAIGLPCEMPLAVLERRRGWRLVEQIFVVEHVPGTTLEHVDLNTMDSHERWRLMWSAGRTLRLLERNGYRHADAKSANWIAWADARGQAKPIMVDLDAMRTYGRRGEGAARLARSLRAHPQIADSDLATLEAAFHWRR